MIKVYISDCTRLQEYFKAEDQDALLPLMARLDVSRKEKINELKKAGDKGLCLGASLLLLYALEQQLGQEKTAQEFWTQKAQGIEFPQLEFGENGKPKLSLEQRGFQLSDLQLPYFNLSHSGNLAVCAMADEEVGIDIQKNRAVSEETFRRIVTKPLDTGSKMEQFLRTYTIKEAYAKLTGRGIGDIFEGLTVQWKEGKVTQKDESLCADFVELLHGDGRLADSRADIEILGVQIEAIGAGSAETDEITANIKKDIKIAGIHEYACSVCIYGKI